MKGKKRPHRLNAAVVSFKMRERERERERERDVISISEPENSLRSDEENIAFWAAKKRFVCSTV